MGIFGHSHDHESHSNQGDDPKNRKTAAILSLIVSSFLLAIKFAAFKMTHSQAILSDALESIVNVLAASMALFVIVWASKPADEDHPYGHGKAEFFSAAFEGGLITFAGFMILFQSFQALFDGVQLHRLDEGLFLIFLAAVINLVLGKYLLSSGKKLQSAALTASAHHVLSDVWTSVGVIAGLVLVYFTGYQILDPIIALIVGIQLSMMGIRLVKKSASGLLDEEDGEVIEKLSKLFTQYAVPGIIRVHYTRVIRSGERHHIDAHVVVPEFWNVEKAHYETDQFEVNVMGAFGASGEIMFHTDPCRRAYCKVCDYKDCKVRKRPFEERIPFSPDELRSTEEPDEFTV